MNNNSNSSSNNQKGPSMDDLIKQASGKIGTSPAELKKQIDNGKLDEITRKLPPKQAEQFKNILANPKLAQKMMQAPQAKAIMKKFFNS